MKDNNRDIYNLLRQFEDHASAEQMTKDIRQADALLNSMPSPHVSANTIETIRQRVRIELHRKKSVPSGFRLRYWMRAAAAAMILLAAGSSYLFNHNRHANPVSIDKFAYIWEDSLIANNDPAASLTTKVEYLASLVESIQTQSALWLEDDGTLASEMEKLETLALDTDFWKG